MITEVARAVLAELETSLDALRTDVDLVAEYQRRVFERQVQVERAQGTGFVSDRAFDNLAYAAEHTLILSELIGTDQFKSYMDWVAQGVVFYLRPHQELLRDDGVRAGLTWDSMRSTESQVTPARTPSSLSRSRCGRRKKTIPCATHSI